MGSTLLELNIQSFKTINLSNPLHRHGPLRSSLSFLQNHTHSCNLHGSFFRSQLSLKPKPSSLSVNSSSSSPSTPPTSREEAILQAKTCLSTTLSKPLNNPKLTGKLKKLKQPRFLVEIPVIDDSPASLAQLALDVFIELPIKRKGIPVKILVLWPSPKLKNTALEAFKVHSPCNVDHADISSIGNPGDSRILGEADLAVFMSPESSQLPVIESVTDGLYPKPAVIFNPRWGFEEEGDFGELSSFVGSFEVIYSFMGLEVKGVLSKRRGVVFKCVRDGVVSGEQWSVFMEEEGQLKVVSKFKTRPSIGEVENTLYNLMAINSPITKSAKFLRDLVSNVTRRK